ncbi:ornithine cyclodeaminase family protein [Calycomorphotria hydatis]|uniref:L-lysine cyclodeaminase n=1 Tax=Calycomorphotria hydatis TaxID=2528027 RepID=A0A517T5Q9_9PLAN|nr:ornithine cyclodeaminase family protein [Calycomorphotria hydatis]QDT63704.1 L-lysine cyclodeaminase [Calycomorphotria hydatis]
MRYITEDEVRRAVDMPTAITVIEEAFRQLALGNAQNSPRRRVRAKGIMLHSMSAAADYLGVCGWKEYTTTRDGANFLVGLYDNSTGKLIAQIEADYLGQLRTGAATGVATKHLANPDARSVGLFGAGTQARTQLEAVCCVRDIEHVTVYSRREESRQAFAKEMSAQLNIEVTAVSDPSDAVRDRDIIITATNSRDPLFDGHFITPGTHLNLIGCNSKSRTEVDLTTIQRANLIACDDIPACQNEAGDFIAALEAGVASWADMLNLGDIINGSSPVRATPEEITIFKSVGLAIEDVALGAEVIK